MEISSILIALIPALVGSAGMWGLVQFIITRKDRRNDELAEIKKELSQINTTLEDTITRVTRSELRGLIHDESDRTDAIVSVAEYYFLELGANAYMHTIFRDWAKEHNVNIDWLPKLKKKGVKNGRSNKTK